MVSSIIFTDKSTTNLMSFIKEVMKQKTGFPPNW